MVRPFDVLLWALYACQTQVSRSVTEKDRIQTINLQVKFLNTFCECVKRWGIEDRSLEDLFTSIESIERSELDHYIWEHISTRGFERRVATLQESIKSLKPKLREVHEIVLQYSAQADAPVTVEFVVKFVDSVLDNLNDLMDWQPELIGSVKEQFKALKEMLRLLCGFLHMAMHCVGEEKLKKFSTYVGVMAENSAYLTLLCLVDKMDENMARKMKLELSDLLQKMKPNQQPEIREICILVVRGLIAIKASESMVEFSIDLLASLQDTVRELQKDPQGIMVSKQTQIEVLHDELKFLKASITKMSKQEEFNDFLTYACFVASEAVCVVYSFYITELSEGPYLDLKLSNVLILFKVFKLEYSLMELFDCQVQKENIHEEMRFLRSFLIDLPQEYNKHEKLSHLLTQIEGVASQASFISDLFNDKDMDINIGQEISLLASDSLEDIEIIKEEIRKTCLRIIESMSPNKPTIDALGLFGFLRENTIELLGHNFDLTSCIKDKLRTAVDKLDYLNIFLREIVKDRNMHGILKDIIQHVDNLACKTKDLSDLYVTRSIPLWFCILYLSDVVDLTKLMESEVREVCPRFPDVSRPSFPKTDGLGFINFFLENLEELLDSKAETVDYLKLEIAGVQEELLSLRSFLIGLMNQYHMNEELEDLWTHMVDMAFKADYVIGLCLTMSYPQWYQTLWLSEVIKDIRLIKIQVMKIKDEENLDCQFQKAAENSNHVPSPARTPNTDEAVVGFKDEIEAIIDQMRRGSRSLDVISVVGMPGLGKTTLAWEIYNDHLIESYFDVRAWCCVSQAYRKRELLLEILSHVVELTDEICKMTEDDLADKLRRCLLGRRYLIVVDDVWETAAWDNLVRSFPDNENGSRIMLTSRIAQVALHAKLKTDPHHLRFFTKGESWDLLKNKLFQHESCPQELVEVGEEIAENCQGLPLAVVLMAGLLARTDKTRECWKQVGESLSSRIVGNHHKQSMDVVELSYNHLPDHLKPCFLYFGAFLEDEEIPARKLKWLWIAEGLVQKCKLKSLDNVHEQKAKMSLEDLAEEFLLDLIDRSLVANAKRRATGGIKSCGVHDILHEFCLKKAKEDNFLLRIHGRNELFFCSPDDADGNSKPILYEQHRLSIYSRQEDFSKWEPAIHHVRSLSFTPSQPSIHYEFYDLSHIPNCFKLLRVLDLGSINTDDPFEGIKFLVHLRYLAVRASTRSIPSSIAGLWNLETLLVKGLRGEVVLPDTIWNMSRLRNVHINDRASFVLDKYKQEYWEMNFHLDNVETLSTPLFFYGDYSAKMIKRFPSLRRLRCIFLESWGYSKKSRRCCNQFPMLGILGHLESVKVLYYGRVLFPCEFNFPSNLKKLTLSKFRLPWNEISQIGKLPNLEVLKLLFKAFEGKEWEMKEGEFPNLRQLKLDNLTIVKWKASSDEFLPRIEQLVLQRCKHLEEIPYGLGDLLTLQRIEVQWCSRSAATLFSQIQEEQEAMGNYKLKVLIHPTDWGSKQRT